MSNGLFYTCVAGAPIVECLFCVERTLLSAAFDVDRQINSNLNGKGGGQECPPYTI
jgi:hypothetical protein